MEKKSAMRRSIWHIAQVLPETVVHCQKIIYTPYLHSCLRFSLFRQLLEAVQVIDITAILNGNDQFEQQSWTWCSLLSIQTVVDYVFGQIRGRRTWRYARALGCIFEMGAHCTQSKWLPCKRIIVLGASTSREKNAIKRWLALVTHCMNFTASKYALSASKVCWQPVISAWHFANGHMPDEAHPRFAQMASF